MHAESIEWMQPALSYYMADTQNFRVAQKKRDDFLIGCVVPTAIFSDSP